MMKLTIKFYLVLILFIFLFIAAFFTKDAIQTNLLAFSPLVPAKHSAEPCKHCVKNSSLVSLYIPNPSFRQIIVFRINLNNTD